MFTLEDLTVEQPKAPRRNSRRQSTVVPSPKFEATIKIVMEVPKEDKLLLFSQWTGTFDLLEPLLESREIKFARYDGSMSDKQRVAVIEKFSTQAEVESFTILVCSAFDFE